MRTYICSSPSKLSKLCEKISCQDFSCGSYLWLNDRNEKIIRTIESQGFVELWVASSESDQKYRDMFLQAYVDCIDNIAEENISSFWQATDIASKNRFTSQILILLQEFISIVGAVEKNSEGALFVINPSWVLIPSLKKYFSKKNIKVIFLENHIGKWKTIVSLHSRLVLSACINFVRFVCRSSFARYIFYGEVSKLRNKSTLFYVIKTFIYHSSFLKDGVYFDSFFGSLPAYIKDRKNLIIFAFILGNYNECLRKIRNSSDFMIIPFEAFLSPWDVVRGIATILFLKIRIRSPIIFLGYDITDIINNELFRTRNGITLHTLLHFWATKRISQVFPVETFLFTYENNPWEKMCIYALRRFSPSTQIIGYCHTVISPASVNIFLGKRGESKKIMPDKIFTIGRAPMELLKKYGKYEYGAIEETCGLKFEYIWRFKVLNRTKNKHILIAPEGVVDVCHMINYVFREMKEYCEFEIRIRMHPILQFEQLQKYIPYKLEEFLNIHISKNTSLIEDIEWSDAVLYWGSTVGIEALTLGKPVVYYQDRSLFNCDPLFGCTTLKWVVRDQERLIGVLGEIYTVSDQEFSQLQEKAREYIKNYICPVTKGCMEKFL